MSKNLLIIGDSYSTFKGYIPDGFNPFYSEEDVNLTGMTHVEETWWYQVVHKSKMNLILNSSYSGSTICNTGYDGADVTETSFIGRLNLLIEQGFFRKNKIDCIIVFGGTNDDWAGVPIGSSVYANWSKADLYSYGAAVFYFFSKLKSIGDNPKIYTVINSELKPEIRDRLLEAACINGIEVIELKEIDKRDGHPTSKGMQQIAEQVLKRINES